MTKPRAFNRSLASFLAAALGTVSFALTATPALAAQMDKPPPVIPPAPVASEPYDFEAMDVEEALDAFRTQGNRWIEDPCDFGVPITAQLERLLPDALPMQRASLLAQAFCADEQGRPEEGPAIMRRLHEIDPALQYPGMTFYFARANDDAQLALDQFSWLEREQLSELDSDTFWPTWRMIILAGRGNDTEDLALRWFESNQINFINSDFHDSLALEAMAAAAREGREDLVPQLLIAMINPSSYISLLTDRQFEVFWPQIEERAGPNLTLVAQENIETQRRRLVNAPRDRQRFSETARALHYNGDFAEVIALADQWREREERGLELEEGDAWALNLQAYAYDSLGEIDRADAIFDELAQVDAQENFWVVNFVINRASRLIGYGRWEEGLEAAGLARSVPGSTYAEMIVAKDHTCALYALGRAGEAESELAFLRENRIESVHLAAQGLLCAGLRDEAAELLIEGLRDPVMRVAAVGALQVREADLFYTQSILPAPRDLMADYPELASAYYEQARDLPEAFIPRAALLRATLDLPEWE